MKLLKNTIFTFPQTDFLQRELYDESNSESGSYRVSNSTINYREPIGLKEDAQKLKDVTTADKNRLGCLHGFVEAFRRKLDKTIMRR